MARPFLLVNPRAGDRDPAPRELLAAASRLGLDSHLLRGDERAEIVARAAADRGASTLGVAGGDGSLAPVAAVALERDLPFLCVPYGTRNHFARDLGLDCDDPLGSLAALEGRERRVDVGEVGGRIFLNNVSLGLYASLVHDHEWRTKNRLVAGLRMLPAAVGRTRRPLELSFEVGGRREHRRALVVVVANNDYALTTLADLGTRDRLDEGLLHAYVIEAASRRTVLALLARAAAGRVGGARGWAEWEAATFSLAAARARIHAAVDGEHAVLASPLEFRSRARALRVLVPPSSGDGGAAGEPPR